MNPLILGSGCVNTDEWCLSLVEMNLVRPMLPGTRRCMIITVMRNDAPEQCWFDLGPSEQFKAPLTRIICGDRDPITGKYWSEHKVGEALDMANRIREGHIAQPEPPPVHDLAKAFREQPDLRRKARKKVSTFGPGAVLQRS